MKTTEMYPKEVGRPKGGFDEGKTTERKVRNFVIIVLLAALAVMMLAACSSQDRSSGSDYIPIEIFSDDGAIMPYEPSGSDVFIGMEMEQRRQELLELDWDDEVWDESDNEEYGNLWDEPADEREPEPAAAQALDPDPFRNEGYIPITDNVFVNPAEESAVSFTLQIDTASYRNVARFINSGHRPPPNAVRVAEMINYFNYDMVLPTNDSPFSIYTEIGPSPFNDDMHLAFIRVRAQDIDRADLPGSNLTFLIDTSGSMAPQNRLPLLQQSLALLVENLDERDTVSVVTYAGCARVLLDSVPGNRHDYIMDAINGLRASGGTAGGPGIMRAYELANQNFNPDMNNRIILATDGDFNIGVSNTDELEVLMAEQNRRGIHMTLLGFGVGNYMDRTMETIARNGNGAYHYVDNINVARKIFVEELVSNMFVIAEEVRAQVVFNPETVSSYRLIGYENRIMENRHFDDDSRDAGEVGVGSDLVIMFEIQMSDAVLLRSARQHLFTVRIRYHEPGATDSNLIEIPAYSNIPIENSNDFNFAASVAAFGHILRNSEFSGNATVPHVLSLSNDSIGPDTHGHRRGFIELVEAYQRIR